MSAALVEKLMKSFDELDRCIEVTYQVLTQKDGIPGDVIMRVEQYSDIVKKQRLLAHDLQRFIDEENWEEVGRLVKLINGLSSMIRDDAQAILASATGRSSSDEPADARKVC